MRKITILSLILFTMTLQGQNELLSSIDEWFDGTNWQYSSGSNYDYDSNNNLMSTSQLSWNPSTSKWSNSYKTTYTYNLNNKADVVLNQSWNPISKQFEDSNKTTYTYVGGDITESVDQTWDGAWQNEYKSTFIYVGGRIVEAYFYEWDGAWVATDRSTVTYNANNRFDFILSDDFDGTNWINGVDRQLFTYDGNNRVKVATYENWDDQINDWVEEEKTEYTIDTNGNREKEVNTYDSTTYEETYGYDMGLLMSSFAHPFKDKTGIDYIVEDNPYYNKLLSSTSNFGRTTYNYDSSLILGIADFKIVDNNIKVFPNPTSGNITIESLKSIIKKVEIYNTIGSRVFSTQENQFNIDFLKTGVYFLNITSMEGAVFTRKIIRN